MGIMPLGPPVAAAGAKRVTAPSPLLAIGVTTDGVMIGADALAALCLLRSSSPSWISVRSDTFRSLMKSREMVVDNALGADRDTLVGLDTIGTTAGTLVPGIGIDELT